jgi:hypothetical protein
MLRLTRWENRARQRAARPECSRPEHGNVPLDRQVFWLTALPAGLPARSRPRTAFPLLCHKSRSSGTDRPRAWPITAAAPQRLRTVFPIVPRTAGEPVETVESVYGRTSLVSTAYRDAWHREQLADGARHRCFSQFTAQAPTIGTAQTAVGTAQWNERPFTYRARRLVLISGCVRTCVPVGRGREGSHLSFSPGQMICWDSVQMYMIEKSQLADKLGRSGGAERPGGPVQHAA